MNHQIVIGLHSAAGALNFRPIITGDGEVARSVTIPAGAKDLAVPVDLRVGQLATLLVGSEAALTVKVNSASSPAPKLELKAGRPLLWYDGDYSPCPLGADVEVLYVSNAGDVDTVLEVRALLQTPAASKPARGKPKEQT